jgi:hypothetical protein
MRNKYATICMLFFSFLSICLFMGFAFNPPNGNTGAPGDALCTTCHFPPGTQTGTITIDGLDDPIISDTTYNLRVELTLESGIATRAGFQLVALHGNTESSASIGTFSNLGSNVATSTSGNRTYLEHQPAWFFVGSTATYTADWTAPASAPDQISFYAAGLLALGGGVSDDALVTTSIQDLALDDGSGTGSGEVPDGSRTPGTPLLVRLEPEGELTLEWDESCLATDVDYAIYEGQIGDFTTHVPLTCSTGGLTIETVEPAEVSSYYLVVPTNGTREGGYGSDSAQIGRPQANSPCFQQDLVTCP